MGAKKKYKKQVLRTLKNLAYSEHHLLETMTNMMLLKEAKKNKIEFKKGDTFSLVYEQKIVDDKVIGAGKIVGAEFNLSNIKYSAFLYKNNNVEKYYNDKGESLEKAFIRNPIDFIYSFKVIIDIYSFKAILSTYHF